MTAVWSDRRSGRDRRVVVAPNPTPEPGGTPGTPGTTCPLCGRTFICSAHLRRHRREVRCDQVPTFEERFWSMVDRSGGPLACWLWKPVTRRRGYGALRDARAGGRTRTASHIAWEFHYGKPFPADRFACHTCDNPPCCNPAHLFVGTNGDNVRDSVRKGRGRYGGRTECTRGHPLTGPGRCQTCRTGHNRARYNPTFFADQLALIDPDRRP